MTKPKTYAYDHESETETDFSCRLTASAFKHASRVNRNDRVRNSVRRDGEKRENGACREKNLHRSERI